MERWVVGSLLLLAGPGLAGCAATTAPSAPPEERLVVLNAGDLTLTIVPVDTVGSIRVIGFGPQAGTPTDLATRADLAVIAGGSADEVVVVNIVFGVVVRRVALPVGSWPSSVAMVTDRIAYVSNAGTNTVTRIDVVTGDTASVRVGQFPRDLLLTRGRLFVVNGNVSVCPTGLCSLGESWLTVVDPALNALATGRDSVPLPSPGNARSATLGGDGLVYLVHTGNVEGEILGRLTIVDPVVREEVGSFGGFGLIPAAVASDGGERLFVASTRDGLMEFNTRTRRVIRGAGEGIAITDNVAVAVDSRGRVYAIDSGGCLPGVAGRIRIYRADLTEARGVLLGSCPVAANFVQVVPPGVPK